jgi:CDP-diacylglycerol--glycerol-3-phosphate 3-phosphatidyltransferase
MSSSSDVNFETRFEIDNLPNRLTIFRILLIPVVLFCLFVGNGKLPFFYSSREVLPWVAAWIFVIASITDFLDGYIARKKKLETIFGSFLDPIADKFLVVSSLIALQAIGRISVYLTIIFILREFYITSLRLLATTEDLQVPVNNLGKWKTATQMIGIPMLMVYREWQGIPFDLLGIIFIYISAFLSMYSASQYSFSFVLKVKHKKQAKKKEKEALKKEKEREKKENDDQENEREA